MEKAIEQTKLMLSNDYAIAMNQHNKICIKDANFKQFYWFTNENIKAYLSVMDVKSNQKALCVLASGDHVFNLIAKGIFNIDTFDINKLTEYYVFGLKMALILKNNYNDFIYDYTALLDPDVTLEETIAIIYDALPYMNLKYRKYWKEIVDYYKSLETKNQKNKTIFNLLSEENVKLSDILPLNIYLESEDSYNKFKDNLIHSKITFNHSNITNIMDKFKDNYDYILFSNILDYIWQYWGNYWDIDMLNKFVESLKPMLSSDALIFLHYCFEEKFAFRESRVLTQNFEEEEKLKFKGKYGYDINMILKRIKK